MKIRTELLSLIFLLTILLPNFLYAQSEEILSLKVQPHVIKVVTGKQFKVNANVDIHSSWHINSNKPNDDFLIPSIVTVKGDGIELINVKYPEAKNLVFSFSDTPVSVYEGKVSIELTLISQIKNPTGRQKVEVILDYQACNDVSCSPPNSESAEFEIEFIASKTHKNTTTDTLQISETSELENIKPETSVTAPKSNDESSIASTLEESGLFLSLIFIFFAGLALNLTPCVYPLIPITIGYFGGQTEGKTGRLLLLGILYVLGMAITYSVIGVVTSLSGSVFGSLLQNPFVIIGIVILFVALALSQFGIYEFKLPDSWVAKAGGAKGGVNGAFFMGLTMGVVAAPCIGPFVLGLVTYVAAKGDPLYGFLMFFVLALGLGFPYLILAIFSGKIKNLPRAGLWMEGVKHIFGLLLIGMALYFLSPLLPKSIQSYVLPVFGITSAIILLFVDRTANSAKVFRLFKTIFSVIVLALSIYTLIPSETLEPEWQKFSAEKYEASLNNNERMVIDFFADWCIPCKELDALTFSDKRVLKKFERFMAYKVDMTKTNEINEKLRKQFDVVGMPTVLIINSEGNEIKRITGFVNADEFLSFIQNIK